MNPKINILKMINFLNCHKYLKIILFFVLIIFSGWIFKKANENTWSDVLFIWSGIVLFCLILSILNNIKILFTDSFKSFLKGIYGSLIAGFWFFLIWVLVAIFISYFLAYVFVYLMPLLK